MQNFLFQSSLRIRIGCSRWKLTYTFAIVSDFKQLNMLPLIKKNTYGIGNLTEYIQLVIYTSSHVGMD